MSKRRWGIIWQMPSEDFCKLVNASKSTTEILTHFELPNRGYNNKTLWERMKEEGVDTSHLIVDKNAIAKWQRENRKPLSEIMMRNSSYARGHLKERLLKEGVKQNVCEICGLQGEWQGKPLTMILDHINGINNDHREENLRMVCPNCDSQLPTFTGKNTAKNGVKKSCKKCGKRICRGTKTDLCRSCVNPRLTINYAEQQKLLREVKEIGYCATGRKYGVSDNTIRKWIKRPVVNNNKKL